MMGKTTGRSYISFGVILWCVLEGRESRKEYFPFKPGNAYHKSRLSLVNTESEYGSCRLLPPWTDPYLGLDTVSEVQE